MSARPGKRPPPPTVDDPSTYLIPRLTWHCRLCDMSVEGDVLAHREWHEGGAS